MGRSTVSVWRHDKRFKRYDDNFGKAAPSEQRDLTPVDIVTFVTARRYLNKAGDIRPVIMQALQDFYAGDYHTALFGGAIGSGKTYALQLIFLYELYVLSCMIDPHSEFGLDSDSKIVFAIQNRTERLAQDNDFATIKAMILKSPYFRKAFPPISRPTKDRIHFGNNISIFAESGDFRAVLGLNAYVSFMDETDYMTVSSDSVKAADGKIYDQAKEMFNVARSRQQSRFYLCGRQRSKILLASSAHYIGAFSSTVEAEAKQDAGIFVWKRAIWEARDPRHYSDEVFHVFAGDQARDPHVLGSDDVVDAKDRHLIITAPVDFLPNARRDIFKFLMDDAGIAVQPASTFITDKDQLSQAFRTESILSRQSITSGEPIVLNADNILNPGAQRFCHLDLSKSRDSTGIGIGHVSHFDEIIRGDTGELLPFIVIDAVLEIRPPKHSEIDYGRIRQLLYAIRRHIPLVRVTADQAFSADLLQQLAVQGFSVGLQSVDRGTGPYQTLKESIADGRLSLPKHDVLHRELIDLQINWKRGKIDHPVNGSKDCADSVAGVVYGLSQDKRLRIESGAIDRLMPTLGSIVTGFGGRRTELDQYLVENDPLVRAFNRPN